MAPASRPAPVRRWSPDWSASRWLHKQSHRARRTARSRTRRAARACNRTSSLSSREIRVSDRVAVVGIGQTKYAAKRQDVSIAGLLREAAVRALDDAGMTWSDIDAVVIGKAPDMFEGVMMPELYLADALGAVGKPMIRVHTAGSVGGSTGVMASHLVSSGAHRRGPGVCFQKQRGAKGTWGVFDPPAFPGRSGPR